MNVGKEIAVLKHMTVAELREKYVEVFGEETRSRHKVFLVKRIAWRLVKNLDAIRSKALPRIEGRSSADAAPPGCCDPRPHPAIEDFLIKLRRACG